LEKALLKLAEWASSRYSDYRLACHIDGNCVLRPGCYKQVGSRLGTLRRRSLIGGEELDPECLDRN